jgi:hypothetical protein
VQGTKGKLVETDKTCGDGIDPGTLVDADYQGDRLASNKKYDVGL